MAKENVNLASDPSKINPYGAPEEQLSEYQQTLKDQISALENRYAQPNWFKVAAGFLKPQLGGFGASLGSATEALGENVEQQRASALPIAQMRAQLAQSNILTGQNKTQAEKFAEWKATGKPMDQATYAELNALSPGSAIAAAAKSAYEGGAKDIENARAQQRMMLDAIQMKQAKGMPLSPTETSFLKDFGSGLIGSPEAGRAANIVNPDQPKDNSAARRAQGDVEALKREMSRLKPDDPRRVILEAELEKATQQAGGMGAEPGKPAAAPSDKHEPYYPQTFKFPDVSSMSDPERESAKLAYQRNVEDAEKRSEAQVGQWKSLAADPVYSAIDSEYTSAINLLKTQPDVAKKVFNLLRKDGSLANQIASAAQAGMGINFGSMAANVSVPTEAFMRAGLNEEQQLIADRLVRAMIVVGNAKLASQGITPEKGQDTYKQIMEGTKASLQQNAATALHNLQKDYVTFQHNKKLYDQVVKEHRNQSKYSPTPYTDVINSSPEISRINTEARAAMHSHESDYQKAIRARAEKRRSSEGG